ncbi:hypothetical protein GCM10009733_108900 [Nonomuraea maheshkhaliensis]|uniref:Uncharacterized protein n=1 Tax=Nonomuraea maheshkhaliensis TaxID=419590 RepID=A0ABN2HY80_9ACTN
MTSTSLPPDDNPFPGADKREWTNHLSTALAAETNLPLHITNAIAAYFVHPKGLLTKPRGDSQYRLRPETITHEGGLKIFNGTVHGFAGNSSEYNERIRSAFHSPVRQGADPFLMLPPLETGHLAGQPAPFLTTSPVTPNHLASLLETMESALDEADRDRGYRLTEDVATHGQQTWTLHVPLVRRIREKGSSGAGERSVVDLMAVKGANRSRARLTLHGLKARDIVFGIRPQEMLRNKNNKQDEAWRDDPISADPYYWVPILANLLREIYADPEHSEHEAVRRAAKVATVPFQLVIGADDLSSFHNVVFDPNRVDHRRPPLDYGLADKAASDVRALLRELTAAGRLTEADRAWLAGEGPDPSPRPAESPVDARDRRDIAIFNAVFPADTAERALVREVIGEPAPYATGKRHVETRTRMISAVISDGYGHRWNPRVLDGLLPAGAIKNGGFRASTDSWSTLLDRAEKGDSDALDTFLVTRGIHWLAEYKIVEADRGSMGAQAQGEESEEGEENTPRIRRGGVGARAALLLAPVRAIALMRELARATNAGTHPRQIDEQGNPVPDTAATRTWFDQVFPKTGRRPKKPTPSPEPGNTPAQPDPTPQELAFQALASFQAIMTEDLPTQVVGTIQAAQELHDTATDAGVPAFPVNVADTVIPTLTDALNALRADVRGLSTLLIALQGGTADTDDFNSACKAYLNQAADQ